MFPVFAREFGLNFAELGLLVSVFFVVSGIGQALAGFVVDKVGARPVLFGALVCFAAASVAAALAPGYAGLMLAAALAGVGNAPFHPADFTILNKRVSTSRLGHAFSVHSISGNLGWALAPVFLIGLSELTGNWRLAYAGTAVVALAVLALLVWQRARIDDRSAAWPQAAARPAAGSAAAAVAPAAEHPMAFLKLPAVWLCFSFFFWTTASLSAVQSFAGPALSALHGLPLSATAFVVTGYMICGAVGMALGGFLVARAERLERTIALCMAGAAGLPGVAITRHAHQAGLAAGGHRARVRHRLLGARRGLCAGRAHLRLADGPRATAGGVRGRSVDAVHGHRLGDGSGHAAESSIPRSRQRLRRAPAGSRRRVGARRSWEDADRQRSRALHRPRCPAGPLPR